VTLSGASFCVLDGVVSRDGAGSNTGFLITDGSHDNTLSGCVALRNPGGGVSLAENALVRAFRPGSLGTGVSPAVSPTRASPEAEEGFIEVLATTHQGSSGNRGRNAIAFVADPKVLIGRSASRTAFDCPASLSRTK
jgi:hypothetical protein